MDQLTLYEWLMGALAISALAITILAWIFPKDRKAEDIAVSQEYSQFRFTELPALINDITGIPPLRQLTAGMKLDDKGMVLAEKLYKAGLAQFNHFVNNRDSIIEESRREMERLANHLGESEISLAEMTARTLATATDEKQQEAAQIQYELLSHEAQTYADHKRTEIDIERRNARDFFKNVPRTDYTSVKARIASGAVRLDAILSDLPVRWQAIRTLNDKVERPPLKEKPPKQEFLHLKIMTEDRKLLEDERAERDGDWILSYKHDIVVPYQEPVPLYVPVEWGKPPVQKGEVVVITKDPDTEWDTELWRQGGYLDQLYLRARTGRLPEQLQRAWRKRLLKRTGWVFFFLVAIVDIGLFVTLYL